MGQYAEAPLTATHRERSLCDFGLPQGKAINAVNGTDLQNPQAGAIRQLIKPLLELCLTPGSVANTASVTFYFWTQPHSQPPWNTIH